jgi:choline transport protein
MASYNSTELDPVDFGKRDARANINVGEDGEDYHDSIRGHTRQDRADMLRMGKVQELKRNYRPLSALAFTVILQGTWEVLLT